MVHLLLVQDLAQSRGVCASGLRGWRCACAHCRLPKLLERAFLPSEHCHSPQPAPVQQCLSAHSVLQLTAGDSHGCQSFAGTCLLSRCAFKTRITRGVANPSPPPSLPALSKQSALVGLCGNRQAPITAPSLGELPRNVDEIRELKGADFSNGISMDAGTGFPACGSGIAMAASSQVQEQARPWEEFNATGTLRQRKMWSCPFPTEIAPPMLPVEAGSLKPAYLSSASAQRHS